MAAHNFRPGQVWLDTDGVPIQAHGGGMLYRDGIYYWFGENKAGPTGPGLLEDLHRVDVIGINCYSSRDLYNWQNEGIVLAAQCGDPSGDLHPSKVVERPKVLYNGATGKYVMWLHIDTADYALSRAGVAIADSPLGPYGYLGSFRPHGAMSRDMTVFQDDDGEAYLIFASDGNRTMRISRLTGDYLRPCGEATKAFEGHFREAPAVFKRNAAYCMITSGCTGWDPNEAEWAQADNVLGPWRPMGNPCCGPGAERTFGAQSAFVLPLAGKPDNFVFMADIWNKRDLADSRYAWLPLRFDGERPVVEWLDEWDLETL
jgi:hypothetical protein